MKQYVDLITTILREGRIKTDRTGTGTISIFGHQSVYYMKDGFPLLTMKKTYPKGVFEELFWFLQGDTNIRTLNEKKVHIWDEWPYAKYKKYAESVIEPDFDIHIDDTINNCTRIMTQKEFVERIVVDDEFAKKWGDLGPVYGKQWVDWGGYESLEEVGGYHYGGSFGGATSKVEGKLENVQHKGINQIQNIIDRLKTVPDCRRLIVSAWNVPEIPQMALAPCHVLFQFITEPLTLQEREQIFIEKYKHNNMYCFMDADMSEIGMHIILDAHYNIPRFRLSLQLYQRSADTLLGIPFNVAAYSLLLHMVAQVVNMVPYKFVHSIGDAHLYLNHKNQVNEFLNRTHGVKDINIDYWSVLTNPNESHLAICGEDYGPKLPQIKLNPEIKNIFDFTIDDVELINYNPLPAIKAPVAV